MIARLLAPACAALLTVSGTALAQDWDTAAPSAMDAPPTAGEAVQKRASSGLCTILRGEQVLEQQNCKSIAEGEGARSTTSYVWPSGNRTVVGGTEDDFSVNGNEAAPLTDTSRGLCLKVEKTGNTFCYKEGARVKAAAKPADAPAKSADPKTADAKTSDGKLADAKAALSKPADPKAADLKTAEPKASEAKAGSAPAPDTRVTESATAVAGAAATVPAAATAAPALAEQLAEESKRRQAAEDEVKALKAELARLNEAEANRAAAEKKSAAAEAARKDADAKAQRDATLAELDKLKAACAARDSAACERALVLAREAAVTGSIDKSGLGELERLQRAAEAPFGIPALAILRAVPISTWAAGSLAVLLGMMLLASRRRREIPFHFEPNDSLPGLEPVAAGPSLDPFAGGPLPPLADTLPRTTPPPLPAFATTAASGT